MPILLCTPDFGLMCQLETFPRSYWRGGLQELAHTGTYQGAHSPTHQEACCKTNERTYD